MSGVAAKDFSSAIYRMVAAGVVCYAVGMKVLVFYRPTSEHARMVEEFIHDLQTRHNFGEETLKIYNVDSREGASLTSLYDIMAYPAVLVTGNDGSFIKGWTEGSLPMTEEVASYAFAY